MKAIVQVGYGSPTDVLELRDVEMPTIDDDKVLALSKELTEAGKVRPVIDRQYPLAETSAAIRYVGSGAARGKVSVGSHGGVLPEFLVLTGYESK